MLTNNNDNITWCTSIYISYYCEQNGCTKQPIFQSLILKMINFLCITNETILQSDARQWKQEIKRQKEIYRFIE